MRLDSVRPASALPLACCKWMIGLQAARGTTSVVGHTTVFVVHRQLVAGSVGVCLHVVVDLTNVPVHSELVFQIRSLRAFRCRTPRVSGRPTGLQVMNGHPVQRNVLVHCQCHASKQPSKGLLGGVRFRFLSEWVRFRLRSQVRVRLSGRFCHSG